MMNYKTGIGIFNQNKYYAKVFFNLCNFFNNHAKHGYYVNREEVDMAIGYVNQIMKVFK